MRTSAKAFFALALFSLSAHADLPIASRAHWRSLGYRTQEVPPRLSSDTPAAPAKKIPWPVVFEDARHSMGNVMAQYQSYGDGSYFHGGCDLRTQAGEWIVTPVGGVLAAGHYGYSTNDDGSLEKEYLPWPASGNRMYFEVSITTDDGTRFEFHHVDRDSLPPEIVAALDRGQQRIEAGTRLGRVIEWSVRGADGSLYHHTHYNVIRADGVHLNPEALSESVADANAPTIHDLLALDESGKSERLKDGTNLTKRPKELVLATTDRNDQNVYVHTPSRFLLSFSNGSEFEWDFRNELRAKDGSFPDIRKVFAKSVKTPEGKTLRTEGNYQNNFFLIRLPLPEGASGRFTVTVEDQAGNRTAIGGTVP